MKHRPRLVKAYRQMLRLYPAAFRAEFGDEMEAVFAQAAGEAADGLELLGVVAGEVRDLPLRLMQEHWRGRRVLVTTTGMMMEPTLSLKVFRFFSASLFVALAAFAVMVVLPFYALGLQSQTPMEVISGSLGPEAWPPYSGSPNPLPGVAVFVLLAAPIWNAVSGVVVLLMLAWLWRRLPARQRLFGFAAVVAAAIPAFFIVLPAGYSVTMWWFN